MIALVPLLPCATVKVFGEAVKVKFPRLTFSLIVVVALRLPDVPVTVIVADPTVAVPAADRVRTLDEVAGFGLKAAVTPAGSFEATSVTLPENAFTGVMAMVLVALPLGAMVTALGEAERVKLCFANVRLMGMLFVSLPEVPVMITVAVCINC
jgi:hypothetical protein